MPEEDDGADGPADREEETTDSERNPVDSGGGPTGRDERIRAELASRGDAAADPEPDVADPAPPDAESPELPDAEDPELPDTEDPELPDDVLREAERLTRLARRAVDDAEAAAYREARADRLAEHGYAARIREGEDGDVLVCYPAEWLAGGAGRAAATGDASIDPARIDDVDRAREAPLAGAADPDGWDAVHERNRAVAERVRARHGDVHGANADALADFASNHYAKPVAALTADELAAFREEYFPRNAWPTDDQRAALDRSLELVYRTLDGPMPGR